MAEAYTLLTEFTLGFWVWHSGEDKFACLTTKERRWHCLHLWHTSPDSLTSEFLFKLRIYLYLGETTWGGLFLIKVKLFSAPHSNALFKTYQNFQPINMPSLPGQFGPTTETWNFAICSSLISRVVGCIKGEVVFRAKGGRGSLVPANCHHSMTHSLK